MNIPAVHTVVTSSRFYFTLLFCWRGRVHLGRCVTVVLGDNEPCHTRCASVSQSMTLRSAWPCRAQVWSNWRQTRTATCKWRQAITATSHDGDRPTERSPKRRQTRTLSSHVVKWIVHPSHLPHYATAISHILPKTRFWVHIYGTVYMLSLIHI